MSSGYAEGSGGGGRVELPAIPATMNPMELGDWLCLIGPILRDISSNSAKWWEVTVAEAQRYYELWRVSTPVQRVKIEPKLPELLTTQAYLRTEQRGMGLLLRAMSDELKKVIIANRDLTSTHLIWRLLITFEPGGSGEKGQLLQTLTTVAPGTTPGEAARGDASNELEKLMRVCLTELYWSKGYRRSGQVGGQCGYSGSISTGTKSS